MAEESSSSSQDRNEEATPERREEFRGRGQVAISREITSVFVFVAAATFMSIYFSSFVNNIQRMMRKDFQIIGTYQISDENFRVYMSRSFIDWFQIIIPVFIVTITVATFVTFAQTRMNWSWKRVAPDFKRLNPFKGVVNMVNTQALVNLLKGLGKMISISCVAYAVLRGEWVQIPSLLKFPIAQTWSYWGGIIKLLFFSVACLLLVIAAGDYTYNHFSLEKKLKMTKQEVKEDYKKREQDPHVKGKMRRMQREIAMAKMMVATKDATVLITNPTHYAIAIKYEMGMRAPLVVAKGIDFNAQRLREVAKDNDVPIVENKPLARTLYKVVEVGEEIPESLYKGVSEIIRYVFKLKGKSLVKKVVS